MKLLSQLKISLHFFEYFVKFIYGLFRRRRFPIPNLDLYIFLAPDIQEEILFSDERKVFQLSEHKIRKIPMEISWTKQREMWNEICNKLVDFPHTK